MQPATSDIIDVVSQLGGLLSFCQWHWGSGRFARSWHVVHQKQPLWLMRWAGGCRFTKPTNNRRLWPLAAGRPPALSLLICATCWNREPRCCACHICRTMPHEHLKIVFMRAFIAVPEVPTMAPHSAAQPSTAQPSTARPPDPARVVLHPRPLVPSQGRISHLAFQLVKGLRHGSAQLPASLVESDGSAEIAEVLRRVHCTRTELSAAVAASRDRLQLSVCGVRIRADRKHSIPGVLI